MPPLDPKQEAIQSCLGSVRALFHSKGKILGNQAWTRLEQQDGQSYAWHVVPSTELTGLHPRDRDTLLEAARHGSEHALQHYLDTGDLKGTVQTLALVSGLALKRNTTFWDRPITLHLHGGRGTHRVLSARRPAISQKLHVYDVPVTSNPADLDGLFLRWSQDPALDLQTRRSWNHTTGVMEAGLSAWSSLDRAALLAGTPGYLYAFDGHAVGTGSDGEPVFEPGKIRYRVADHLVMEHVPKRYASLSLFAKGNVQDILVPRRPSPSPVSPLQPPSVPQPLPGEAPAPQAQKKTGSP